jgi:hypothetical protein
MMERKFFLLFLCVLLIGFAGCDTEEDPNEFTRIIVLDNLDPNWTNPPFDDRVSILDHSGTLLQSVTNINIAETVGGQRKLAAPEGYSAFVVCEDILNDNYNPSLTRYNIHGVVEFSVPGNFHAACFHQYNIYALTQAGTIYGDGSHVIDSNGNIILSSTLGGFDLVVDSQHQAVWFVGENIIKLDLNLNPIFTIDPITWVATSVDTDSNGNAWVCERSHSQIPGSVNRLLKISPSGVILTTINTGSGPVCVRVDRSTNHVWAIHGVVYQYDQNGNFIQQIPTGGWSLAVNPVDQGLWVAGTHGLSHYTSNGSLVNTFTSGFSTNSNKYVAVAWN